MDMPKEISLRAGTPEPEDVARPVAAPVAAAAEVVADAAEPAALVEVAAAAAEVVAAPEVVSCRCTRWLRALKPWASAVVAASTRAAKDGRSIMAARNKRVGAAQRSGWGRWWWENKRSS